MDSAEVKLQNRQPDASPTPYVPPKQSDGRIPAELLPWVHDCFPEQDLRQSLDELKETECLELSEFLDLAKLEQEAADERAGRKR